MKYIVFLVVIAISVFTFVNFLGCKKTKNLDNKSVSTSYEEWHNYNKVLWENNKPKDILGYDLPSDISGVNYRSTLSDTIGDSEESVSVKSNWLVAGISYEEFQQLVKKLGMTNMPDLIKKWPEVFECEPEYSDTWHISKISDANTYFGEDSTIKSFLLLKYEGKKIYVKRSTYYEHKIDDKKQMMLKVIKRNTGN